MSVYRSVLTILVLTPLVGAAAPPEVDTLHCADCHGADGVSTQSTVPILAGQSPFVISDALIAFQEGARPCRQGKLSDGTAVDHCEMMVALEVDTMDAIGEYYAGLEFRPAAQPFDAALAAAGAQAHEAGCSKCHTEGGSVADDDSGILAGQWMGYLRQTFADYQSGERPMPGKMQPKMEELTEQDVEALLHYYASQQGD